MSHRNVQLALVEHLCYPGRVDAFEKLAFSSSQMALEAEDDTSRQRIASYHPDRLRGHPREAAMEDGRGRTLPVYYASGPNGRTFPLLKTMLTSACERDCLYCAFRAGRDMRRATFRPEEMAGVFLDLHRAGVVEGLFLSTGILRGGANTQNRLLDTAEILRHRLGFTGYLHLKIMPGAERGQIARAMQLANRVSINLEAPNAARLHHLAPHKDFESELLLPLGWMHAIRSEADQRLASSATQFVVGAAGESDVEILFTTASLYRAAGLARVFFMVFQPCPGTPLESHPPESPQREHRLYQASYLLRDYGFDLEDLPLDKDGHLPREKDPKSAWAEMSLREDPIELNTAPRERLIRVPGIGPSTADRLIHARRETKVRDLSQLRALGIVAERAAPYIILDGSRPPHQRSSLL